MADDTAVKYALTGERDDKSCSVFLILNNTLNIEGKTKNIAAGIGNNVDISINRAFTLANETTVSPSLILLTAGCIFIVFLSGFFIIYNIYYISVTQDIRFYGLLKTIGTTGRQIKKIVIWQINFIYLIFMPPGLILGYFIGWRILSPLFMSMSGKDTSFAYNYNWQIFIFTLVFTYITIAFSALRPLKRVLKMSCINALTGDAGNELRKNEKHSKHGTTPVRMALSDISRDKKKTFITVWSISLAVVIFMLVVNIADIMLQNNSIIPADFRIGPSPALLKSDNIGSYSYYSDVIITDDIIKEIKNIKGISEVIPLYTFQKKCEPDDKIKEYYKLNDVGIPAPVNMIYFGISDKMYKYLNISGIIDGSFDAGKFGSQKYVMTGSVFLDYNTEYVSFYSAGDTISMFEDNTYNVMAVGSEHHDIVEYIAGLSGYSPNQLSVYIPLDMFFSEFDTYEISSVNIFVTKEYNAGVKTALEKYKNTGLTVTDKNEEWADFNSRMHALQIVGYSLCAIIFLIGIMNYINSVFSSIVARRREYAMLEAVGMTSVQLRIMLLCEGFISIVLSAALGFIIGIPLIDLFLTATLNKNVTVNISAALIMFIVLLIISIVTALYAHRMLGKASVVERIRMAE